MSFKMFFNPKNVPLFSDFYDLKEGARASFHPHDRIERVMKRCREFSPFNHVWNPFISENDTTGLYNMAINLYENKDSFLILVEATGFKKEELELSVQENELVLHAKKQEEAKEDSVSLNRVVKLPITVDKSTIQAEYKNGILHISIQKQESAKPQTITIQ